MHLSGLDLTAAAGASAVAGLVNAIAGGGTLISFPTLVGLGVPAVNANMTNTVSLTPGYLAGTWVQRADLEPQIARAKGLAAAAIAGGLAGSILLAAIPGRAFRASVPFLMLASSVLLLFQDRLRARVRPVGEDHPSDGALVVPVFLVSVYGGFFGAGLGIVLLAVLGLFRTDPLPKLNALKQALSFLVNLVAATFFCFSGRLIWLAVPVMAVGGIAGGLVGGRLVPLVPERPLRYCTVLIGVAVAVGFWVV